MFMKTGRIQEVTAAIWLGLATVNGVQAMNAYQDATKAEQLAKSYDAFADPRADSAIEYANEMFDNASDLISIAALDLGVAAVTCLAAGISIRAAELQDQLDLIQDDNEIAPINS